MRTKSLEKFNFILHFNLVLILNSFVKHYSGVHCIKHDKSDILSQMLNQY